MAPVAAAKAAEARVRISNHPLSDSPPKGVRRFPDRSGLFFDDLESTAYLGAAIGGCATWLIGLSAISKTPPCSSRLLWHSVVNPLLDFQDFFFFQEGATHGHFGNAAKAHSEGEN